MIHQIHSQCLSSPSSVLLLFVEGLLICCPPNGSLWLCLFNEELPYASGSIFGIGTFILKEIYVYLDLYNLINILYYSIYLKNSIEDKKFTRKYVKTS